MEDPGLETGSGLPRFFKHTVLTEEEMSNNTSNSYYKIFDFGNMNGAITWAFRTVDMI